MYQVGQHLLSKDVESFDIVQAPPLYHHFLSGQVSPMVPSTVIETGSGRVCGGGTGLADHRTDGSCVVALPASEYVSDNDIITTDPTETLGMTKVTRTVTCSGPPMT